MTRIVKEVTLYDIARPLMVEPETSEEKEDELKNYIAKMCVKLGLTTSAEASDKLAEDVISCKHESMSYFMSGFNKANIHDLKWTLETTQVCRFVRAIRRMQQSDLPYFIATLAEVMLRLSAEKEFATEVMDLGIAEAEKFENELVVHSLNCFIKEINTSTLVRDYVDQCIINTNSHPMKGYTEEGEIIIYHN